MSGFKKYFGFCKSFTNLLSHTKFLFVLLLVLLMFFIYQSGEKGRYDIAFAPDRRSYDVFDKFTGRIKSTCYFDKTSQFPPNAEADMTSAEHKAQIFKQRKDCEEKFPSLLKNKTDEKNQELESLKEIKEPLDEIKTVEDLSQRVQKQSCVKLEEEPFNDSAYRGQVFYRVGNIPSVDSVFCYDYSWVE